MKRLLVCTLLVLLAAAPSTVLVAEAQSPATQPATAGDADSTEAFKNDVEKLSYAIGLNIATGLKQRDMDIDIDALVRGLRDVFSERDALMTFADSNKVIMEWQTKERDRLAREDEQVAEKNKKEAETFLAENKTKEGVKTTDSGLQYKVIEEGAGPLPKPTDMVKVNYRGTLIDGTEFDSSYKRGEPAQFIVNQVIEGWQEALPMMKVGAKWKLFIPPDLAYGPRRQGQHIGPNSLLIFDVELLEAEEPNIQPGAGG